jgi:hypothetical protein
MSKRGVSVVIHTLLTDQNLRDRFAESPMDVLADLHFSVGIELTVAEVEALARTSLDVWRSTAGPSRDTIH